MSLNDKRVRGLGFSGQIEIVIAVGCHFAESAGAIEGNGAAIVALYFKLDAPLIAIFGLDLADNAL